MKKNNFLREAFTEWFPVRQKSEILSNLKRNWYFPISAIVFFVLSASLTMGYILALPLAFAGAVIIASQIPSAFSYAKKQSGIYQVLSVATAVGICLNAQATFYGDWSNSPKAAALKAKLPAGIDLPLIASVAGAVLSLFFVYFFVMVFMKTITKILSDCKTFCSVKKAEWIIYALLFTAALGLVIFTFIGTDAFYGSGLFDIIYTSDSSSLVQKNAYMSLTHPENDLRQPLFSVFTAPFTGIAYLIARVTFAPAGLSAVIMNIPQLLMLFAANFILAKMLRLDPIKRVCFMILTTCTYSQLLFVVMMEQYISAYFWLIFCMYLICEKNRPERIALWGTGSTLLTGMVLLPFMSGKSPLRNFRVWFTDTIRYGVEFVALLLVFCRFDVIFNIKSQITALSSFSGHSLTFTDKIYQYFEFIRGCFASPSAHIIPNEQADISWQLIPATTLSIAGVLILALCVLSAILNRDKKSSLLSLMWIGFSAVILIGLGWGTKENGLILYALYFGWAFLALLFQLAEKIENMLKIRFFVPLVTAGAVTALLIFNIPAMSEMLDFAFTFYPA